MEHGPGLKVALGHAEGLLDAPQVVVGGHDRGTVDDVGGQVRHVSLEPGTEPGSLDDRPVDLGLLPVLVGGHGHEPVPGHGSLTRCDLLGLGDLGVDRPHLAAMPLPREVIHHPAGAFLLASSHVPTRLDRGVVGGGVAMVLEVGVQVVGNPGLLGADDERAAGIFQGVQVGRRQHARIRDHDQLGDGVAGLELLDHWHQRLRLCLVPLEQGDLEGESTCGHQQPDRHPGVDPVLLTHPHPTEPVLIGHLEVQRGQVIHHQPDRPTGVGVPPAGGRYLAAVITGHAAGQALVQGVLMRCRDAHLRQHPQGVGLRRRLDDPGGHQRLEHLISQHVEAQLPIRAAHHLPQQLTAGGLHHRFPGRLATLRLLAQVEHVLAAVQALQRRRHQYRQLGRIMRGPDMLQDSALPVALLNDLDGRRA